MPSLALASRSSGQYETMEQGPTSDMADTSVKHRDLLVSRRSRAQAR